MLAVLTLDQRRSRSSPDLVEDALSTLAPLGALRAFERTAGDELQGVVDEPVVLVQVVELLLRQDRWNVGVGLGEVELPLPSSTRAGRGAAFLRAREAVSAAKTSPWHLRVVGDEGAGPARALETTWWLWAAILSRRSARGWEVADLVEGSDVSYEEAGRRLGISQSAVSQRAQAAGLVEGRRARELAGYLAAQLLTPVGASA
ncbi:transposase [Nocardioides psychrotolerans]|uniref:transposase n=1 Tax=Nocardioides psychrotolerans TaxID=1005945 RepID=UPI003137C106